MGMGVFKAVIMSIAFVVNPVANFSAWGGEPLPSLFFPHRPQEGVIQGGLSESVVDRTRDTERQGLTLDGITFISPTKWSIWLNGRRIVPHQVHPQVEVLEVTRRRVRLRLRESQSEVMLRLGGHVPCASCGYKKGGG